MQKKKKNVPSFCCSPRKLSRGESCWAMRLWGWGEMRLAPPVPRRAGGKRVGSRAARSPKDSEMLGGAGRSLPPPSPTGRLSPRGLVPFRQAELESGGEGGEGSPRPASPFGVLPPPARRVSPLGWPRWPHFTKNFLPHRGVSWGREGILRCFLQPLFDRGAGEVFPSPCAGAVGRYRASNIAGEEKSVPRHPKNLLTGA